MRWGHSVHNGDHVFSAGQEFDAGDSEDGNGGGDYDLFSLWVFGFLFCGSGQLGSLVLCRILLVRFFLHCSYSCVPSEVFYVKCDYFNTGI